MKKCMEQEVEGPRPRGRPKKTWKEVVREDCQARKLNKEDATDRCKWRKMIKEARWSGWVWVGECSFWYRPTRVIPDQRPLNGRRCCCCSLTIEPIPVTYLATCPLSSTAALLLDKMSVTHHYHHCCSLSVVFCVRMSGDRLTAIGNKQQMFVSVRQFCWMWEMNQQPAQQNYL